MDKSEMNPIFKARYINNGDQSIKERISTIKIQNKTKLVMKHKNYNKKYNKEGDKVDKMALTGCNFFCNIGGLPGVQRQEGNLTARSGFQPNSTFFSNRGNAGILNSNPNTFRTITENSHNISNRHFPILPTQQSKRLLTETLSSSSPRNTFHKTQNSNFSTISTSKPTNQPQIASLTEEDTENIISFYYMNESSKGENTLKKKYIPRETKRFLYSIMNIEKGTNEKENELINHYLAGEKKSSDFQRTMNKYNKTEFLSEPYFFRDPAQSLKKLKINGKIFQNMMNLRTDRQMESYNKIYEEEAKKQVKLMQMPKIRETKANKTITDRLMKTVGGDNVLKRKKTYVDFFQEETEVDFLQEGKKKKAEAVAVKQMSREQLLEDIEFLVTSENPIHKPQARAQFTLTWENDYLYLIGGLSSERMNDVWVCNLNEGYKWKIVEQDEEDEPVPRAGHTAVVYRREIFIYGGSTPRDYFKSREDMLIFSTVTHKFYSERPLNRTEAGWRRNHIAVGVNNTMLVHGGIDEQDKFSSDCLVFDFAKFMWARLDFKGNKPPALAYHSAELVLETDLLSYTGFNLYKSPDIPMNKNFVKRIKHEGIYLFGGMDENRQYTNDIRILKIGKKPTEWIYPKLAGTPPKGRINSTLNFYHDLNILIVHGGRNDKEKYSIFNDIFVLDLENLTWIKTGFQLTKPIERTEHCSIVLGDQLLILGGINARTFNPFDISIVHLDLYNKKKDAKFERRGNITGTLKATNKHMELSKNLGITPTVGNENKLKDILRLTSNHIGNTFSD